METKKLKLNNCFESKSRKKITGKTLDQQTKTQYFILVEKLAKSRAQHFASRNITADYDDLYSLALQIVAQALNVYRPGQGSSFSTYCYSALTLELGKYCKRLVKEAEMFINLDYRDPKTGYRPNQEEGISYLTAIPPDRDQMNRLSMSMNMKETLSSEDYDVYQKILDGYFIDEHIKSRHRAQYITKSRISEFLKRDGWSSQKIEKCINNIHKAFVA